MRRAYFRTTILCLGLGAFGALASCDSRSKPSSVPPPIQQPAASGSATPTADVTPGTGSPSSTISPLPTGTSTTLASASAHPTDTTASPDSPTGITSNGNAAAAEQVVQNYYRALNSAAAGGSIADMESYYLPECEYCANVTSNLQKLLASRHTLKGLKNEVDTAVALPSGSSGVINIETSLEETAGQRLDSTGAVVNTYDAHAAVALVIAVRNVNGSDKIISVIGGSK